VLEAFDQIAMGWLNAYVGRSLAFDEAVRSITDWHFVRAGWLGCFIWWAWFACRDADARVKLLSGLVAVFLVAALSRCMQVMVFVHFRPFVTAYEHGYQIPRNVTPFLSTRSSFPSDTATLYFAMAALVWCISRRWGIVAFAWVALIAALPRAYLTYHWPSDIVGAFVLGTAAVAVAYRYCIPGLGAVLRLERIRPQVFYPLLFVLIYQMVDTFDVVDQALYRAKEASKAFDRAGNSMMRSQDLTVPAKLLSR
jgi:undecaprenyl-diphosphatase